MQTYLVLGVVVLVLGALLLLRRQNNRLQRRLAALDSELSFLKRGPIERLVGVEREFYSLRREYSRAKTTISRLCRMQTGMTLECEKLEARIAALNVDAAPEALQRVEPLRQQVVAMLDWSRRLPDRDADQSQYRGDEKLRAVG